MMLQTASDGSCLVVSLVPGGPADCSGLVIPGDVLVSVNCSEVAGLAMDSLSKLVLGAAVRVLLPFPLFTRAAMVFRKSANMAIRSKCVRLRHLQRKIARCQVHKTIGRWA